MRAVRPLGMRRRGGVLRLLALLASLAVALAAFVPRGLGDVLPITTAVAAYAPRASSPAPTSAPMGDQAAFTVGEEAPAAAAERGAPSWSGEASPPGPEAPLWAPAALRLYLRLCVLRN
jgi:hypothetical protein